MPVRTVENPGVRHLDLPHHHHVVDGVGTMMGMSQQWQQEGHHHCEIGMNQQL